MLQRDNVSLVTDVIAEVRPDAVVTADGTVRPVDAIVVATGFHVTQSPGHHKIKRADGRTLGEVWQAEGMAAYKGSTVAGFPNLFLLTGPNTGLGHSSMVLTIESQLNYLLDALATMDEHRLATVEVRRDEQRRYNDALQRRMSRTIWTTGGCSSWYLDSRGVNTTLWPGFTFTFRQLTRRFDLAAYNSTAVT
jgi:cyclohexanone monooxygenase